MEYRESTAVKNICDTLKIFVHSKEDNGDVCIIMPSFYFDKIMEDAKENELYQISEAFEQGEEKGWNDYHNKNGILQDIEYPTGLTYFHENYIQEQEDEQTKSI